MDGLKAAVEVLKGSTIPGEHPLDVCEMVLDTKSGNLYYPMTLMAYAGYHARFEVLECLIEEGAGKSYAIVELWSFICSCIPVHISDVDMGIPQCGSPLLQMLVYAHSKQQERNLPTLELDIDAVEYLVESEAVLSRVLVAGAYDKSTALEMAISFQRFDIAQMLVEAGADPILGGDGTVSPLFLEYAQFKGSNQFVKWLLKEHLQEEQIPAFVDRIVDTGVVFRDDMQHMVTTSFGMNAAHALLLSGHEQAVQCLVDKCPDILKEVDGGKRTALHLAAKNGDIVSVKILLGW